MRHDTKPQNNQSDQNKNEICELGFTKQKSLFTIPQNKRSEKSFEIR